MTTFHGKLDYYTDRAFSWTGVAYEKEIIAKDGTYWDEVLDEWVVLPDWLEYCIIPERIIYVTEKCCLVFS